MPNDAGQSGRSEPRSSQTANPQRDDPREPATEPDDRRHIVIRGAGAVTLMPKGVTVATISRKTTRGLSLELTEIEIGAGDFRRWQVVMDGKRPGFVAEATGRALTSTPGGSEPHEAPWAEEEIINGLVCAVEDALFSPLREKLDEGNVRLPVTAYDIYKANGRL